MGHMGLPDTNGVFLNETTHSCAEEVETQVCLRNFLGWDNTKKKIGRDKANSILNDLSGPIEVAFIDPLCFEIEDHAPVLKSTLLHLDTTTKEGHAENGNSIINTGDASNPPKPIAMEVSSFKPNLFLEIQKDQNNTSSMQTDKQI